MRNSRQFIQSKWKKMGDAVSNLISEKSDHREIDRTIELSHDDYERYAELAEQHQTTVDALVHHALELYLASRPSEFESHTTLEQKARNPLFHLDGLANRKRQSNEQWRNEP